LGRDIEAFGRSAPHTVLPGTVGFRDAVYGPSLPPAVYGRFCELMFVQDLKDLEMKLVTVGAWAQHF
jgi:hypothetical protein